MLPYIYKFDRKYECGCRMCVDPVQVSALSYLEVSLGWGLLPVTPLCSIRPSLQTVVKAAVQCSAGQGSAV